MLWNNNKNNFFYTLIFLILLRSFVYPQVDTNFLRTFFSNVAVLPWQVEIDSIVSLLTELGVDTCIVTGRNNYNTVGPSVKCKADHMDIGLGYRWDKDYIPQLDFFVLHTSNCDTCLQYFDLLKQFDYIDYIGSEPIELQKRYRDFSYGDSSKIRIEAWNECCPGNRIKIYRTIYALPKKNSHSNKKQKCHSLEELGTIKNATAKKR